MVKSPNKIKLSLVLIATIVGVFSPLVAKSQEPLSQLTIAIANKQHSQMNHQMSLGPADANYDLRFIDGMIMHHQGAIAMASEALSNSQRPEIQQLAKEIIATQEQEISELQQWRQAWYPQAPSEPQAWAADMNHMMAMTPEQMEVMNLDPDRTYA